MAAWGYEFYLLVLKVFSRVSGAHSGEILSAREDKIRIPKRPCNVLFILKILMKFLHKRQLFFIHFRNSKIVQLKWSPIAKCLSEKCYDTGI